MRNREGCFVKRDLKNKTSFYAKKQNNFAVIRKLLKKQVNMKKLHKKHFGGNLNFISILKQLINVIIMYSCCSYL